MSRAKHAVHAVVDDAHVAANGLTPKAEAFLDELVIVADEIHEAMLGLDHAIQRLETALARHQQLRAEHEHATAP